MKSKTNYPLLLGGQFLGAFGDNALPMLILGPLMEQFKTHAITEAQQSTANILYLALLFIPYVLLAPLAGFLSDRYAKTTWLLLGSTVKIAGALVCFSTANGDPILKGAGYFIVGIGSCVYSPAKYGILPEILPVERLVKANGMVELLTLVAILTGTIGGSLLFDHLSPFAGYAVVLAVYGGSMATIFFMDKSPAHPESRFAGSMGEFIAHVWTLVSNPRLGRILIGTSLFWFAGAIIKVNCQPWGQQVIGLQSMTEISLLLLWLSVGIMIGSVAAGRFFGVGNLRGNRVFGFVLAGAVFLLGTDKWLVQAGFAHVHAFFVVVLIVAGVAGGLFLIPLNAALQAESHQDKLGKTIATQNCLENLAMLASSAFALVNVTAKLDPSQLFFCLAAVVAVVVALLRIPSAKSVRD